MRTIYRAYCRSVTRAQFSPYAAGAALVLLIGGYLAGQVTARKAEILATLKDAAAVTCVAVAAAILLVMAARLSRATGAHTDTLPGELNTDHVQVPRPADLPERVPGTYTWTIKPEHAEMKAAADALADDRTGVVVSEDGAIYELAGAEEDES